MTRWRLLRPRTSCCAASDAGQLPRTKVWYLVLEDVTDSHRVATEWPLPPTETPCRAIVAVLALFHAA